jgi:hypothetical protein
MNISDKELLKKTKDLVIAQRRLNVLLIEHLTEVQRRRLYADLGYSSLYKYLVKELKLSEGAAVRRIDALRLTQKVPETKSLIQKGELSLSVASDAHRFCQNLNREKSSQVVERLKNKSRNEATQELLTLSQGSNSTVLQREISRPISPTETRLHLNLKTETLKKIDRIKAYRKHSTDQVMDHLADLGLAAINYELNKKRKQRSDYDQKSIPMAVKKEVRLRALNRCEFKGCDEIRNLEFEHQKPLSIGGTNDSQNIVLYCKAHNQRAAIKAFGQSKMDPYLNPATNCSQPLIRGV